MAAGRALAEDAVVKRRTLAEALTGTAIALAVIGYLVYVLATAFHVRSWAF